MIRVCQKIINFTLVSHKIAHHTMDYHKDRQLNLYPVVGLRNIKLGSISLNQPNNQNFFTEQMMDELHRFLITYTHDHTIQNVWIQNRGSMFMGGLSYQQLYNNPDYLDKVYKMAALFAKFNKPTFSCVTGGVRNVGAYILSMTTVALTDYSASLRIDQVSKGFVPVAGGSHRLSRLPTKVGHYLALTGRKLDSTQMSRLGFITGIKKQQVASKDIRHIISRSNLFFRQKLNVRYQDQRQSQFTEWGSIVNKQDKLRSELQLGQHEIIKEQDRILQRFALNQYKVAQINYQNATKPYSSFSPKVGRTINNYYLMRHEKAFKALEKQGLVEKSNFDDLRLPGFQIDKILRVFGQDNIHQAIKILQNDNSQWASQTLKELRKMDPLAAVLTYELLNRAQSLSWDQCLDLQYTVAKRLIGSSKLTLKQTQSGSKAIFVNKHSSSRIQDINIQSVIEQFFAPALNQQQKLQLDVPLHSVLPNSDYVQIPDSVRCALNKQFFNDIHVGNQDREIRRWFQNQKIDFRNRSYNIDLLREKILNQKQYQAILSNESKRIQYLMNNSAVFNKFIKEKYDYIDNMKDEDMNKYLKQTSKIVFNQGIKGRFQDFNKTATVIGKQKKLEIFKNLRKTLIKKIVIDGVNVENQQQNQNQSFHGQIYFDQHGRSIYQSKNPNLSRHQPLQKMSQQIRQNLKLDQQFIENQGSLPKQKQLTVKQPKIPKRQQKINLIKNRIGQRYQQYPFQWDRAYQYEIMVKQAAKTSSDLANYMQWDSQAFYNTIVGSPAPAKTYNEIGQQIIQKIIKSRQLQKSQIRSQTILSQTLSKQYFEQLYHPNNLSTITSHKSYKYIKQHIIPKFQINKEVEKFLSPILEQVLKHFQEKYYTEILKDKKLQFGEFDQYIYEAIDQDFISVYKNDILFVYSYFTILKIKEVLHNLKVNGVSDKKQQLHQFFKQNQIEFLPDRDVQFMNKVISKLLFKMLDLHTYTKPKIQLPQNKLLDFLNRVKIGRQANKKSNYALSFQSILLTIGKDRSKLYNKVLHQYIPSQPQYLLQISKKYSNDVRNQQQKRSDEPAMYHMAQNAVGQQYKQRKTLVAGYQYYLGLFDTFIQRASGKYNFLNDYLLSLDTNVLKKQLSSILNMKQNNQQWFDRVSRIIIKQIFNTRIQYEKSLTKGQLLAFDQQFKQFFTPQIFRLIIKYYVQSELESTKQLFNKTRNYTYEKNQSDINEQKYVDIRRNVKNPDAFKRLNNLRMAMEVQTQYFVASQNKLVSQEQKLDLVQEKKQFGTYERFPRQTYNRMVDETFSYGQQKNFDKYLSPLKDNQIERQRLSRRLHFIEDEQTIDSKKDEKFTQFENQIKQLKDTIVKNSQGGQIDSIYKKLQQLL